MADDVRASIETIFNSHFEKLSKKVDDILERQTSGREVVSSRTATVSEEFDSSVLKQKLLSFLRDALLQENPYAGERL